MDSGTMAQWAAVAVSVTFSLAAIVIAWLNRRNDKIEDIDQRQDRLDHRLQRVEADMKHLPSKDMLHELQLTMAEMRGQLGVVVESVRPIKAIAERMQDWALEGARK